MAELLFLASVFLPPVAVVAGALLLVVMPGTPRRARAAAAGHPRATVA